MLADFEIANLITVRADMTMLKYDLDKHCGWLPTGTLIRLKKDLSSQSWEEIGQPLLKDSVLRFVSADGTIDELDSFVNRQTASTRPNSSLVFSNQLETTKSGKKLWWRMFLNGSLKSDSMLMLLGHVIFPWKESGVVMDHYMQVWQPLQFNDGDHKGPLVRNLFFGDREVLVEGSLGYESLKAVNKKDDKWGLSIVIANKTELVHEQPDEVKKALENLFTVSE